MLFSFPFLLNKVTLFRRKGKIKTNFYYKGKNHTAYLSHIKVKITVSRKDVFLVLVYGIIEHPMMHITVCMAYLALISSKSETNSLKVTIFKTANSIKDKVNFYYYRIAKDIQGILALKLVA